MEGFVDDLRQWVDATEAELNGGEEIPVTAYRFLESEKASHWFEKSANDWFPIGNLVARAKVLGYSGMNIPNLAGIKGEPDEKNVLKKIFLQMKPITGLSGWPEVIRRAVESWKQAPKRRQHNTRSGAQHSVQEVFDGLGIDAHVELERRIAFVINLDFGAWWLAWTREEACGFPDSLRDLQTVVPSISSGLSEDYEPRKWALSGHVMALISPVAILLPKSLRNDSLHREYDGWKNVPEEESLFFVDKQSSENLAPNAPLGVPLPLIDESGASCEGQGNIQTGDETMEPEGENHNEESLPGRSLPSVEQEHNGEIIVGDLPSVSDGEMVSGQEACGAASTGEARIEKQGGPVKPETDSLGDLDEEHLPVIGNSPPLVEERDGETGQRTKTIAVNNILNMIAESYGDLGEDTDESVSSKSEGSGQEGAHMSAVTSGPNFNHLSPVPEGNRITGKDAGEQCKTSRLLGPSFDQKRPGTPDMIDVDNGTPASSGRPAHSFTSISKPSPSDHREYQEGRSDLENAAEGMSSGEDELSSVDESVIEPTKPPGRSLRERKMRVEVQIDGSQSGRKRQHSSNHEGTRKRRKTSHRIPRAKPVEKAVSTPTEPNNAKKEEEVATMERFKAKDARRVFVIQAKQRLLQKDVVHVFDVDATWFIKIRMKAFDLTDLELFKRAMEKCAEQQLIDGIVAKDAKEKWTNVKLGELTENKEAKASEWRSLSLGEIGEIVSQSPVLIRGEEGLEFGEAAAEEKLGDVDMMRTVHDKSLGEERVHVQASLRDAIRTALHGNKIVNCLDITIERTGRYTELLDTDRVAVNYVRNMPVVRFIADGIVFTDWGLLATGNAFHRRHIDGGGCGTEVAVVAGTKVWIVSHPKSPAYWGRWFGGDFDEVQESKDWGEYSFLLKPGDRIIMGPCSPHTVLTIDPSIAVGGHYRFAKSMDKTCCGICQAFVADSNFTNAAHVDATRVMVCVLVFLVEKLSGPDIDWEDQYPYEPAQFLILLMVTNVVRLARVLDPRTYDKTLPRDVARAYGVGEAYANRLLSWLATNVGQHTLGETEQSCTEIARRHLVQMARALVVFRHHAEEEGIEGANSSITTESVRGAIEEESFAETDWFKEQWPGDDDEWDELWTTTQSFIYMG
ncbi:hypothetical protein F5879DRAFT_925734 [Lentinula edodes]|nr:hypothetical protein F5879DRAFT_925734 [Lentinula edodes]